VNLSRTTYRSMSDATMFGLQGALARTQRLQQELSSGRRVASPSDDPAAAGSSMKLRSQRQADEQYLRNIENASGRLNVTDNALQQLNSRLGRVRELAIQSRDGAIGGESLVSIAAEISSIKTDVIDLYNTRWLNRPVFGGTVQGQDAIDSSETYIGDDRPIYARISRDGTVQIDTKGTDIHADTVPALLDQLASDIVSNPTAVQADIDALDSSMSAILQTLSTVGARAARVETAKANVDAERLDFTARISENEDVDLPETIMNLQAQQVAYQAALGAASKVLTTSLVDFLR